MDRDAMAVEGAAQKHRRDLRNYTVGTGAYWTETLVDGATRTLVLFYFDRLGYSPLQVASLFVLYEVAGILGYEHRALVSVDFKDDPRSGIIDALSTMVTDGSQVKILAWYDNEWGYANRLVELARSVASSLPRVARAAISARPADG